MDHGGDLPLLLDRLGLGDRLFEVFQRQIELIGMKLGEPLALRLEALRLAQQPTHAVVESISRSRSATAASRSAMAFNANARSASQRINRSVHPPAQHIVVGDLPEPNLRLIHFTAGYCTASGAIGGVEIEGLDWMMRVRARRVSPRGQRNLPASNLSKQALRRRQPHDAVLDAGK